MSEDVYHRRRGGKPEDARGVAGEVYKAVTHWALELTGVPQYWTTPLSQLRADVWKSPRGRLLRDLYTDAITNGEKVAKSDQHADARQILKQLQEDPAVFIR